MLCPRVPSGASLPHALLPQLLVQGKGGAVKPCVCSAPGGVDPHVCAEGKGPRARPSELAGDPSACWGASDSLVEVPGSLGP